MGKFETLARIGIGALAAYELSRWAFSPKARKEVLQRDKYTCQGIDMLDSHCYWEFQQIWGKRASFGDGFMMTAAHYPEDHKPYKDENIAHGRACCTICHSLEELERGNEWGAKQLVLRNSVFTYDVDHKPAVILADSGIYYNFTEIQNIYDEIHLWQQSEFRI